MFGRKDSESFGGTVISNTAESGPGDTPLARYWIHRYPDTPKTDILGQVAEALVSCHAEPQELPGGPRLASVLRYGHTGESMCLFVSTQGWQGCCAI